MRRDAASDKKAHALLSQREEVTFIVAWKRKAMGSRRLCFLVSWAANISVLCSRDVMMCGSLAAAYSSLFYTVQRDGITSTEMA